VMFDQQSTMRGVGWAAGLPGFPGGWFGVSI